MQTELTPLDVLVIRNARTAQWSSFLGNAAIALITTGFLSPIAAITIVGPQATAGALQLVWVGTVFFLVAGCILLVESLRNLRELRHVP
ncbi:hypothetical protein JHC09_03755 [Devosia sp. MC532]|uniref:hypothetical protein n=1 Tax=Devosia sp. MC532 TaxID=2799788 RepID=UPI0018F374F1|nr:hypothetical protein [Devosia sp. MC532]MBJ7576999.1 hypothetical protein [Devosia sp. MC532]